MKDGSTKIYEYDHTWFLIKEKKLQNITYADVFKEQSDEQKIDSKKKAKGIV